MFIFYEHTVRLEHILDYNTMQQQALIKIKYKEKKRNYCFLFYNR